MSSEEVNGGGSFLSRNIGGIILAVILTVIACIAAKLSGGRTFLCIIVALPLSFLGYVIGNKLRLWLHPDFVIASGFMGLLKERIFWRFVPQLVGAFIGVFIVFGIASTGTESAGKTSQLPDLNIVKEKIADDIIQSLPISPSRVKLENAPESSGNTWIGTVTYINGDFQQESDIVANYNSKKKTVTWWFVDSPDMKFNFNPFK